MKREATLMGVSMGVSAGSHNNNSECGQSDHVKDMWGNTASDTTDDELEDLPLDGILERYLIPTSDQSQTDSLDRMFDCQENSTSYKEENETSIASECGTEEAVFSTVDTDAFSLFECDIESADKPTEDTLLAVTSEDNKNERLELLSTRIPDILWRHFNDNNLLNPCEFIDSETIPEISFVESSDETVISRKITENEEEFEKYILGRSENEEFENEHETISDGHSDVEGATDGEDCSSKSPSLRPQVTDVNELQQKESQGHRYELERRLSSHDIKYGQGQVHYKLPDFSKVLPKVKIPKGTGGVKTIPVIKRARSSPNLLGPSAVIRDILDSMQSTADEGKEETSETCELLHLQVSLISPDPRNDNKADVLGSPACKLHSQKFSQVLPTAIVSTSCESGVPHISGNVTNLYLPTEGDKMSKMLREQAQQLKAKVLDFSDCLTKESLPVKEQSLLFQNLKTSLETLEVNYLSTKEKHRELQLQIYRTGSLTVGDFDLEREVEGEIFRLGMLLDDIQEQITKSKSSVSAAIVLPLVSSEQMPPAEVLTKDRNKITAEITNMPMTRISDATMNYTDPEQEVPSSLVWCHSLKTESAHGMQTSEKETKLVKEATNSPQLEISHILFGSDLSIRTLEASTQTVNLESKSNRFSHSPAHVTESDTSLSPIPYVNNRSFSHKTEQYHNLYRRGFTAWNPGRKTEDAPEICSHEMHQRFRHEYGSHLQLSQRNWQHSSSQQKIGKCPQPPNRDLKDKSIKRDRKITKHGKLSIFIQEKEVNVDLSDCTDSEDSLHSDWLISAHTDLSHYRSPKAQNNSYSSLEDELVEIGDTDYDDFVMSCKNLITTSSPKQTRKTDGTQRLTAGYHSRVYKQSSDASIREFSLKSSQASKIPVRAKPKGNFSCQLLPGYKGTYRYSHTDRYNTQIPHFCHSRFSKPSVPLAQSLWFSRKPLLMGKSLDHTDHKIINSVLDQALSTARSMKRTTEHMIRRLAEDLHNAQSYQSVYSF